MIASTIEVELAVDARAELGEGPVWDERAGCLYFVDILRARVHRFDPVHRSVRTYEIGQLVGAVALAEHDLVLCRTRRLRAARPRDGCAADHRERLEPIT